MHALRLSSSNILLALASLLVLSSCSSGTDNSDMEKRTQLAEYKKQISELKLKADALEKELDSTRTVALIPVKVTELSPELFEHFVEVTGNVEADEAVEVSAETSGKITRILIREGDRVRKGDVLATLNSDMVQKSIEEATISLELAKTTFERQKNLWNQKIGSEIQFLQAKSNMESLERRVESLKAQLDMARILSPVDGMVDVLYQKQGEMAGPQTSFARVVNIARLKVYGDIAESHLAKIRRGDVVSLEFPALERKIKTPIALIGNYIDPNNRTFRIRMNINNPDGMIKPNMVVLVKVRDYMAPKALVVNSLLVKRDFKGEYTYVADTGDSITVARKVYVTTGMSSNNRTEITTGLQPGARVISEGFDQISDGSAISL